MPPTTLIAAPTAHDGIVACGLGPGETKLRGECWSCCREDSDLLQAFQPNTLNYSRYGTGYSGIYGPVVAARNWEGHRRATAQAA